MPRYFFNIMEGHSQNLVRDIEGALLADAGEARKEALGLAQDITSHGIHQPTQTWAVIVTDEQGDEVLTVPLSGIAARRTRGPFGLGSHIAKLESSIGRGTIVWLMGAAVLAITVQTAVTTFRDARQAGSYQTASAPAQGALWRSALLRRPAWRTSPNSLPPTRPRWSTVRERATCIGFASGTRRCRSRSLQRSRAEWRKRKSSSLLRWCSEPRRRSRKVYRTKSIL